MATNFDPEINKAVFEFMRDLTSEPIEIQTFCDTLLALEKRIHSLKRLGTKECYEQFNVLGRDAELSFKEGRLSIKLLES